MPEINIKTIPWMEINWPGIIAGLLTISLPFIGVWLKLSFGIGIVTLMISPFGMDFFGNGTFHSPFVEWLCLGGKICVIYFGALLLTGSVLSNYSRHRDTADILIRYSSRKLMWLIGIFIALYLILILFINQFPGVINSVLGEMPITLQNDLPYLSGKGSMRLGLGNINLEIPVFIEYTYAFAAALIASVLGIAARTFHKRHYGS